MRISPFPNHSQQHNNHLHVKSLFRSFQQNNYGKLLTEWKVNIFLQYESDDEVMSSERVEATLACFFTKQMTVLRNRESRNKILTSYFKVYLNFTLVHGVFDEVKFYESENRLETQPHGKGFRYCHWISSEQFTYHLIIHAWF